MRPSRFTSGTIHHPLTVVYPKDCVVWSCHTKRLHLELRWGVPWPEVTRIMTFRVPADLPEALLRASMARKLRRLKPWTQQDIVTEAVREWLERNSGGPVSRSAASPDCECLDACPGTGLSLTDVLEFRRTCAPYTSSPDSRPA